jgi:acyl-CoA dehydrogenase
MRANTLMETSGFSDTQLEVREAIAKICSRYPDVRMLRPDKYREVSLNVLGILGKA